MVNIGEVAAIPRDGETENNDVSKKDDKMKGYLQEELLWFSLGCILFKDLGCDSECFVMTDAFGHLGAGVCVDDNWCDCGYAINPILKGIWEQKFPNSIEILNRIIESKNEVANNIHRILAQGLKTSQQSKDDLKPYLSNKQFNELLLATDAVPANKFISSAGYYLEALHKHVDEKLSVALKWRDDDLTVERAQYKPRLIEVLDNAKSEALDNAESESPTKLERIVHLVRRVKNKTLNKIVEEYLRRDNSRVGSEYGNIAGTDKMSYIVVDELVKRVDKGAFQFVVGWVRTKFTSLLNNFRTTDNDRSVSEVLATPGPISHDWRKNEITIRYRRNHRGDVNLAWVKNSDRVCIFIDAKEAAVSQSWMFDGNLIISLIRSPEGVFTQYRKLGSFSHHKYDEGPSDGEWSNGVPPENTLKEYKTRIKKWCEDNNSLIGTKFCIIYYNTY